MQKPDILTGEKRSGRKNEKQKCRKAKQLKDRTTENKNSNKYSNKNRKEEIMYVIAGLGNPKKEYDNTRHNIGFDVIDAIADKYGIRVIERKHKALVGRGFIDGEKVVLVKPQTFMNLSGESLREVIDYYKVDPTSELIVICDDISLDLGQLRIRKKGSAGGHNGLKNIILHLGTDGFQRIKMGVGGKPEGYDLADYVLGHFSAEEKKVMAESIAQAVEASVTMMKDGADAAMNRFNQKKSVEK